MSSRTVVPDVDIGLTYRHAVLPAAERNLEHLQLHLPHRRNPPPHNCSSNSVGSRAACYPPFPYSLLFQRPLSLLKVSGPIIRETAGPCNKMASSAVRSGMCALLGIRNRKLRGATLNHSLDFVKPYIVRRFMLSPSTYLRAAIAQSV
jgi:hypothetical protein